MTKAIGTMAACAALLYAKTALAMPTAQQKCDDARIRAWKVFASCVETGVAKEAKGIFDQFAAFAKCRHAYFKKWTGFQTKPSLAGSTCIGFRFTNDGTTVTDSLTGLVWEEKTNDSTVHDKDNTYSWSTGSNNENGTAFTVFLATLNSGGFAGASGWRLPTVVELQTIVLDFTCKGLAGSPTCSCPSSPCIDSAFDTTKTQLIGNYWAATTYVPIPYLKWGVFFGGGVVANFNEIFPTYVRAVRGGL